MNITQLVESCMVSGSIGIDNENATLVHNILPGMVDDNNQPLPHNTPTVAEQDTANPLELFMTWEHSGSCYCCLNRGWKSLQQSNTC